MSVLDLNTNAIIKAHVLYWIDRILARDCWRYTHLRNGKHREESEWMTRSTALYMARSLHYRPGMRVEYQHRSFFPAPKPRIEEVRL